MNSKTYAKHWVIKLLPGKETMLSHVTIMPLRQCERKGGMQSLLCYLLLKFGRLRASGRLASMSEESRWLL